MSTKKKLRFVIDFAMSVTMLLLLSSQYTGMDNHEIAGAVMLALFLAHHALNSRWYRTLGKGRYTGQRILLAATDSVLLADMLAMAVSGIGMSQTVFRFLNLRMEHERAVSLHLVSGYLGFLLMGFHLGLHWDGILGMLRNGLHLSTGSKACTWVLRILTIAAAGYGVYALVKQRFFTYITLRAHFVLFDFDEPTVLYELELLAIAMLAAIVGYYLQRLMKYKITRNNKGDSE